MTTVLPGDVTLQAIEPCLLNPHRESALDRVSIRARCTLTTIRDILVGKVEDATRVDLTSGDDNYMFTLTINSSQRFYWEGGTLTEVHGDEHAEDIAAGDANGNLSQLLDALIATIGEGDVEIEVNWKNPVEKVRSHYIETVDLFVDKALSDEWHVFFRTLVDEHPVLVIGDLAAPIVCRNFRVLGPGMEMDEHVSFEETLSYHQSDGRPILPSPTLFAPIAHAQGIPTRDRMLEVLNGVTKALTWYWIASSVKVSSPNITLYFSGSRVVEIENHRPGHSLSAEDETQLADWTFSSDDPAKIEAVRKSASLALVDDDSFEAVAATVLRTAESLFEIARQDVIAEALATRRSARQAAISAASDAAKAAREASTKATERSIVQIAAALAIVVANAKDFVNLPVAILILFLVGAFAVASWFVSKDSDIKAARESLDGFVSDLDEYRDTLSSHDVDHLRKLHSITNARAHLSKAERVARRMMIGVVAILVVAVVVLPFVNLAPSTSEPVVPIPSETRPPAPHTTTDRLTSAPARTTGR